MFLANFYVGISGSTINQLNVLIQSKPSLILALLQKTWIFTSTPSPLLLALHGSHIVDGPDMGHFGVHRIEGDRVRGAW